MKIKRFIKTTITITTFIALSLSASLGFSKEIFVDLAPSSIYKTISDALTAATDGDSIIIGPGIFDENITIKKNISITGAGPNYTTIKGYIYANEDMNVNLSKLLITSNYSNSHGVYLNGSSYSNIKNCVITGFIKGIFIYAKNSDDSAYVTLINNTIVYNLEEGVYIDGTAYYGNESRLFMHGNIVAFNGSDTSSSFYQVKIVCDSISCSRLTTAHTFEYNNFYKNGTNTAYYNVQSCFTTNTNIYSDPKFIDANQGNLALSSDSPCKDAGMLGSIYTDPDGTRNDMGAYAGEGSSSFWPYVIGGPVVTDIKITPTSVPKGGKISIQATGTVR